MGTRLDPLLRALGAASLLTTSVLAAPAATGERAAKPVPKASTAEATKAPPDVAGPPADAERTSSGLASRVLRKGTGMEHPGPVDRVTVHYAGWTTAGNLFDASYARGVPASFGLKEVIAGWTEGLQLMVVGEKRRFWIPDTLAYAGRPGRPQGMLVFDVELISFEPGPRAPADVAAPPPDAERTESGLATKVLAKGSGTGHPSRTSTVQVHYSGWTTDGELFDSTVVGGKPIEFRLDRVIAGWTEALQLMVPGEKRRLWVPEALAYRGMPGRPPGMLVFDVELISFRD